MIATVISVMIMLCLCTEYLLLYVDDMLIISKSMNVQISLKNKLNSEFDIKD